MTSGQARRLEALLHAVHGRNRFYTRKFDAAGIRVGALQFPRDLVALPLTTKKELADDQIQSPPWGTALTEPLERYTRFCQTSSSTGAPMRWLDTPESWQWILDCWKAVYSAARVGSSDCIFFPFSFGPFLGFWAAFEAACQIGARAIPGGGMSSHVRLRTIDTVGATVVCCTPTYALWLAEVAAKEGYPLASSAVRVLIVAGEPGGSIPATRRRIEESWGARVIDHHGLTEAGPVSFECWENPGALHINEEQFICEVVASDSGKSTPDGEAGELIITNLGRIASPVIRYRTGDIVVRRSEPCRCGRPSARLDGGILARSDDMIPIRGTNVYPSGIEAIVRRFPEIVEFRATASRKGPMWTLAIEIEPASDITDLTPAASKLSGELREALGLNVPIKIVEHGTLPRFEMKARRFIKEDSEWAR